MAYRTITKTYKVFKIGGLSGVNKQAALRAVERQRIEDFNEFHSMDLLDSMKAAAEQFQAELVNWDFGLFDRSSVIVATHRLTDEKAACRWINDNTASGVDGSCPFTGTSYDCLFFDYFKKNGATTPSTVRSDIVKAISYMLKKAIDSEENSIMDEKYNEQYAKDQGLEFFEDGSIYHGETEGEDDGQ
jgi:hypothetical protein